MGYLLLVPSKTSWPNSLLGGFNLWVFCPIWRKFRENEKKPIFYRNLFVLPPVGGYNVLEARKMLRSITIDNKMLLYLTAKINQKVEEGEKVTRKWLSNTIWHYEKHGDDNETE